MWLVLVHLKNSFHPSTNQRRKVKEKKSNIPSTRNTFLLFFQPECKATTFPYFTFNTQSTPMSFYKIFRNRQA